ncbi:hydantoinase/oxoprolinase family protein [Roseomonas sp. OT10]|uniref:hydantoinase/oxoprolinase family protein n=1 Tax=Roseomonas cutis TaxID=2897332 RepID=UPI001E61D68F|nr:hydantoinase/oxoprolinase family protein [Roseomonas sp. OT10]UFN48915.1 hydantoinase/oxoprolinase family protein [Roseomonas sp. OT10]
MPSTDADLSVAPLSVAVDIGGTFTDITLQDDATGRAWTAKTPSTPQDPSEAFLTGVRLALEAAGEAEARVGRVLHGTTVATNLILEGKGATTALVTTAGFRHVLEIGRQDIPRRANLHAWVKPARPVPPSRVFEVVERVAADGTVLTPLDEASVADAAAACRAAGVSAVAVCLLHAFAAPAHEARVAAMLREALPGIAVTASSDVLPVVREYERSLATILNAQVMPAVSTYVRRLEERLAEARIAAPLLLMKSNGGVAGATSIRRAPAVTALSGPAAGVVGARAVAQAAGVPDILTVDIGGTSADICLLRGGAIGLTQHGKVGEWPLPLPMVDMVTIGAGGGSLARVTRDGALAVGPESAGARPGPACYGLGGTQATVTDAHVVLGHLPPRLLGGRMVLDVGAAEAAVRREVAEPLGLDLHAAARGILAIADSNMVGALRVVSVERGHDPRDFALAPFGGAGPLHGCALARMLGIGTVLVPPSPGVLCAQGLLAADLRAEFSRSLLPGEAADPAIEAAFAALEAEAEDWLAEEQVAPASRRRERVVLMRYAGQGSELAVPWRGGVARAAADFAGAHRALYGFDLPEGTPEIVTLRVEAAGLLPPAVAATLPPGDGAVPVGTQRVHFAGGSRDAALYDRAALGAGDRFEGPAIVTQLDATTLVPPGWSGEVHESGAILLRAAMPAG